MINRAFFFDQVRKTLFDGKLKQSQVEGLTAILEATEDPSALEYTVGPGSVRFRLPDARLLVVVLEGDTWRVDGVRDPE